MDNYLSASSEKRAGDFSALQSKYPERIKTILNLLTETPYFYREDNESLFMFLRSHHRAFENFYDQYYGWQLVLDSKCARVFKNKWYNGNIPPKYRNMFNFTKRDECIAFMLLLEFFERKIEEESMSIEDTENLRFRFGDLLEFLHVRFQELYPDKKDTYSADYIRSKVIGDVIPQLEKYRFILRIKPPADEVISKIETIYEALPALYHYDVVKLSRPINEMGLPEESQADENSHGSE